MPTKMWECLTFEEHVVLTLLTVDTPQKDMLVMGPGGDGLAVWAELAGEHLGTMPSQEHGGSMEI